MLLGEMHATRVDDDAGHDGDRLVAGAALVAVAEVHSVHPLDHRPVEVGEAKSSWFGGTSVVRRTRVAGDVLSNSGE